MNEQDIHLVKEALQHTRKICVVFHFNPDGDALGSALALYHYFREDGYEVSVISPNAFPDFLNWMEGSDQIIVAQEHLVKARKAIKEADMLFVVDMNASHRAGQDLQNSISKSTAFKVLIDHHVQPEIKCEVMYTTHLTSSASELVFNFLYKYLTPGRSFGKAIAEALYVGIITDTGSMSYACDHPGTYEVLGKLIAAGVNGEEIHQKVYSNYTESRLHLMGIALSHLKIMPEYGASYMYLTKQELVDNHFQIGDTEGFVNYGLTIKGVEFTAFFVERENRIRVSFRSKGKVDVNLFARDHYSGGGHHNAAGAFFNGTIEEAVEHFERTVKEGKY
ncbi:MAG: bifunctional oligoribonuclease/PAP phosphatase NrnA [Bacteroidales bacterium]|nr:bifunctional oligoribonuclease/PAP phosphatase NrnA [Bacteroidales bacterium]